MSVVAKDSGNSGSAPPPTGIVPALCVDVIDLGVQDTPYNKKQHKIKLVWQLAEEDEDGNSLLKDDGRPWRMGKWYTLSLNEAATLRADLESWRGKPFDDAELAEGFDVEKLLLVPCQLQLVEKKTQTGKLFVGV